MGQRPVKKVLCRGRVGPRPVKVSIGPKSTRQESILATARVFQRRRLAYASSKICKKQRVRGRSILHFYQSVNKRVPNLFLRLASSKSSMKKSGDQGRNKRKAGWTEAHEQALIARLHEYTTEHCHLRIDNEVWEEWSSEFEAEFGAPITVSQLINRQNRLKRYFECYQGLLSDTRLGLDEFRKVMASAETWAAFVQKSVFGNKVKLDGVKNYGKLHDIFAGTYVGWERKWTSYGVGKARKALKCIAEALKCRARSKCERRESYVMLDLCVEILNSMSLSDEVYAQALMLMVNHKRYEDEFVLMPKRWRFSWIQNIVDEHNQSRASSPTTPQGPCY